MISNAEIAHGLSEEMKDRMDYAYFPHVVKTSDGKEYTACEKCLEQFELKGEYYNTAKIDNDTRFFITCPICGNEIDF